jgi:hypothetical protein
MMMDPVLILSIQYFFAALFLQAAWHKSLQRDGFRQSLAGYEMLADRLVAPTSMALALAEMAIALMLIIPATMAIGSFFAIILLGFYAAALSLAISRGNISRGCGCSWGNSEPGISLWLVARNLLLMLLLTLSSILVASREALIIDHMNAGFAAITLIAFYLIAPLMRHNLRLQQTLEKGV